MLSRRLFMAGAVTAALTTWQRPVFAAGAGDARLVVVILRGALDGLAAVAPVGDPQYEAARGGLAFDDVGAMLPLDGDFALNPALRHLHVAWQAKQLLVAHAVATPYRERSHFDGQAVLENGLAAPAGSADGWLNRALRHLPSGATPPRGGLALDQNVPLILRGAVPVTTWAPSILPGPDEDFLARLADLYSDDPGLSARLSEASGVAGLVGMEGRVKPGRPDRDGLARLGQSTAAAGRFLAADDGPRVAVLDAGGWDTHANQGTEQGALAVRLRGLDTAIASLQSALGAAWRHTVVMVVTEFGRTVAVNGSRGSDHGTATCALLVGGAVRGGRVLADWPGLRQADLYQGRDLQPTLDLRAVAKGLLAEHLGLDAAVLERDVFPDSGGARPVRGLVA